MELNSTVADMTSRNYKQRFRAEYQQTLIRRNKLGKLIHNYQQGKLDFMPDTPIGILASQCAIMDLYLCILKHRALIENIELY